MNKIVEAYERGEGNANLDQLLAMPDEKLARNLGIVRSQIEMAVEQKNEKALLKLQAWEDEIIAARFIKLG